MALLELQGVTRVFPDPPVTALAGIDLAIERGQVVSVVGPSGCGKSTLLRIIAGLDTATSGSLAWEAGVGERPVALMPQHDGLYEWNRVVDNVALAERIRGRPRAASRAAALELLTEFGLQDFAQAWPGQLSGGMRSRVAFLRTMLARPALLALDEPFGALDALTRINLQRWLLAAAADRELTILLVTHDVEEAVTLSDRVIVLSPRPGRVVADLPIELTNRDAGWLRDDLDYVRACARVRDALAASPEMNPTNKEEYPWN